MLRRNRRVVRAISAARWSISPGLFDNATGQSPGHFRLVPMDLYRLFVYSDDGRPGLPSMLSMTTRPLRRVGTWPPNGAASSQAAELASHWRLSGEPKTRFRISIVWPAPPVGKFLPECPWPALVHGPGVDWRERRGLLRGAASISPAAWRCDRQGGRRLDAPRF